MERVNNYFKEKCKITLSKCMYVYSCVLKKYKIDNAVIAIMFLLILIIKLKETKTLFFLPELRQ